MARMHSRKKGRAGSRKPLRPKKPTWLRYKPKEIELLIVKLSKEGRTASKIGLELRDTYGIPDVKLVAGKTISIILSEKNLLKELPEDVVALMRKAVALRKHMEQNRQDTSAKRGLQLTESKIKRLIKYYKNSGRIAPDWKYDPEKLKIYAE